MMLPTARAPADIDRYLAPAVLPVPMLQQSRCCAVALVAGMDRKVAVKGSDGWMPDCYIHPALDTMRTASMIGTGFLLAALPAAKYHFLDTEGNSSTRCLRLTQNFFGSLLSSVIVCKVFVTLCRNDSVVEELLERQQDSIAYLTERCQHLTELLSLTQTAGLGVSAASSTNDLSVSAVSSTAVITD